MQSIIIWLIFFLFFKTKPSFCLLFAGCVEGLYYTQSTRMSVPCPNWLSPPPLPQASVSPTTRTKGGGGHTRLQVRGRGEPIWTTGEKAWHSVCSEAGSQPAFSATVLFFYFNLPTLKIKIYMNNISPIIIYVSGKAMIAAETACWGL